MKINNKGFALSSVVYSILILFLLLIFAILSILGSRKLLLDKTKNKVLESLQQEDNNEGATFYKEGGVNAPELLDGMVPIKFDDKIEYKWVVADLKNEWYSYEKKQWANAVVLKDDVSKNAGDIVTEEDIALWYVWIPRFKYTLFNTDGTLSVPYNCKSPNPDDPYPDCPEIEIDFEEGIKSTGTVSCIQDLDSTLNKTEICSDITNNGLIDKGDKTDESDENKVSKYTHPAFTLGDKELTGFWIGKFEISKDNSKLEILPNKTPLKQKPQELLFSVKSISSNYNINGDSHMIKNIEWGAVAYLKQSKYGLGQNDITLNNCSESLTGYGHGYNTKQKQWGCYEFPSVYGAQASTTGNMYGVYDMAGGSFECVMGNLDNTGNYNKYLDKYNEDYPYKLGDATIETKSFYSNQASPINTSNIWYIRGGSMNESFSGIFAYDNLHDTSTSVTTRAILTK